MRESVRSFLATLAAILVALSGAAQAEYPYLAAYSESDADFRAGKVQLLPAVTEVQTISEAPLPSSLTNSAPQCNVGQWCQDCDDLGNWLDNTTFGFGGEAYKSLGDTAVPPGVATGFMDSAGFVGSFNTGFALLSDSPIRGQFGGSYGIFDLKGRDTVSQSSAEQQAFVTIGLYKRSDILADDRICWGLVYDQFWAHQWGLRAGELYVGQTRYLTGYALNSHHELGIWGAVHTNSDGSASVVGPPVRAMNQYNIYSRINWDCGGQTMLYFGAHDPADMGSWLVGFLGQAPLSGRTALYGNFVFDLPRSSTGFGGANELEWNFGVGLMYSWGGKVISPTVSGRQGLPLLPVANNGSLLITN